MRPRACAAMCGTEIACAVRYAVLICGTEIAYAVRCAVLRQRKACYAIGTEIGCALRCAVLRQRIVEPRHAAYVEVRRAYAPDPMRVYPLRPDCAMSGADMRSADTRSSNR
eukprot:3025314-Rhodomonas_salina.2